MKQQSPLQSTPTPKYSAALLSYPALSVTMAIVLLTMGTLSLSGCSRGIKPEVNEPTKLVKLSQNAAVARPVMTLSTAKINDNQGIGHLKPIIITDSGASAGGQPGIYLVAASADGSVRKVPLGGTKKQGVQTELNTIITSGVATDDANKTLIVSTKSADVVALDAQTLVVKWQTQLNGTVLAPALVHNNRVVVVSNDGVVHGLSKQTGEVVWQFTLQTPTISLRGQATPVLIDERTALIASSDGRLHTLDIATGSPRWSRRVGVPTGASEIERMTDVDAMPTVVGNQLYAVSYSGPLIGINLQQESVEYVLDVASKNALAVNNDLLVATTLDGKVKAYDRQSGQPVWETDALAYRNLSNPVILTYAGQDVVAVGDFDGVVHFMAANNGQIIGREQVKGGVTHLDTTSIGNQTYLTTQTKSGMVSVWQIN